MRFSEGRPKRPLLLREITNPFIFSTRRTACLNCWAVTLELDARTPHIRDVAKNLHNATKNKVMETRMEALCSWPLALKSLSSSKKPAAPWPREQPQTSGRSSLEHEAERGQRGPATRGDVPPMVKSPPRRCPTRGDVPLKGLSPPFCPPALAAKG